MSKDLVKAKTTAVAVPENLKGSWGSEGVDSSDILIPRLLLMQPISERVGEGVAQAGDIIKSTTGEVLAPKGKTMEFIPIKTFKTWNIKKLVNGKYEFADVVPFTAANANADLEWIEGAFQYRRDRSINFYVLIPSEIKREEDAFAKMAKGGIPDTNDCLIPALLSFTRTSMPAGKVLATHFKMAQHFDCSPAVATFSLTSTFTKNDKGNYYVFEAVKNRDTSMEELAVCKRWWETLQKATVKIHEDVEATEPVTTVGMDESF